MRVHLTNKRLLPPDDPVTRGERRLYQAVIVNAVRDVGQIKEARESLLLIPNPLTTREKQQVRYAKDKLRYGLEAVKYLTSQDDWVFSAHAHAAGWNAEYIRKQVYTLAEKGVNIEKAAELLQAQAE